MNVAGSWIAGAPVVTGGRAHQVLSPATGRPVAEYASAAPADVDTAVAAARAALPGWAGATPAQRSAVLAALARLAGEHAEHLVAEEVSQTGKPVRLAAEFDVPHGGVGASGFGKDMSDYSLEEYLTVKHVMSDITDVTDKVWHRTVFTKR